MRQKAKSLIPLRTRDHSIYGEPHYHCFSTFAPV
jgi:hypothetical protein